MRVSVIAPYAPCDEADVLDVKAIQAGRLSIANQALARSADKQPGNRDLLLREVNTSIWTGLRRWME